MFLSSFLDRSRPSANREEQFGEHLKACHQGGDRIEPQVRPPARLGPHSVAPLLHRPRACPQARPQAQKGWSIKAHSQDVHNTHVLKIFSAATISDRHMCQTYIV